MCDGMLFFSVAMPRASWFGSELSLLTHNMHYEFGRLVITQLLRLAMYILQNGFYVVGG